MTRPAPPVVLLATFLLSGVAALRVVAAVCGFFAVPEMQWAFSQQYGDEDRGHALGLTVGLFGGGSLLLAVPFMLLAIFATRGHNWARILTWILGGLTLLAMALILVFTVYNAVVWYTTLANVNAAASLVLLVTALVLLTLPPSQRYYRDRRPQPPPPPRVPPDSGRSRPG